jgi:TRAP-type C4-dicarboxylate transport system substrate-binding protein
MFRPRMATRLGAAFLIFGLTVAGCAGGSPQSTGEAGDGTDEIASMEPITLIVSEPLPPTSSNNLGTNLFMDYVTEHTDGKVTFEVYDTSTLHPMQEAISAMESGLSDITLYIPGLHGSTVPAGAWQTGLAAFTTATPMDMLAGSAAATAAFTTGPVAEELAAHNALYLGAFTSDSYTALCASPLETLADAHGQLGRSSGGTYDAEMEAIGMTPVLVDSNEVYEALQRGTVDCQVGALQTFVNDSLAEVAKYYTPLPFSPNTGAGYIMNKEKFDALPASVQEIFRKAGPLFGVGNNNRVIERFVEWYTTAEDEYDVTFVTPADDLADALADFREEQGATLAERAPESVTDPEAVVELYGSVYDDWVEIVTDEFGVPATDGTAESLLTALDYVVNDLDWDAYRQRMYEYVRDLD